MDLEVRIVPIASRLPSFFLRYEEFESRRTILAFNISSWLERNVQGSSGDFAATPGNGNQSTYRRGGSDVHSDGAEGVEAAGSSWKDCDSDRRCAISRALRREMLRSRVVVVLSSELMSLEVT